MVRKVMLSKVYYNQMAFSCKLMIIWTLKVFLCEREPTRNIVVIRVKIVQAEKTIEIHLVRLTEVCGKVK